VYDIIVILLMIVVGFAFIAAANYSDKFVDKDKKDDDPFNHRKA
jgi:1,4-dihydroxy-2-naphthoate octaprenyltransferase